MQRDQRLWCQLIGALVGLSCLLSCDDEADIEVNTVTLHRLASCRLAGDPEPEPLELRAHGDFPASGRTTEILSSESLGVDLVFPASTRSFTVRAAIEGRNFLGLGEVPTGDESRVDVLLWPSDRTCALQEDSDYPAPDGGQAFGFHRERGVVLVAGGDAGAGAAVVGALTWDVRRGGARIVDASARDVLLKPRAFATATGFGEDMLVAGGEDPLLPSATEERREVRRDAEVFSIDDQRFTAELIELRVPRTRHMAHVLPSGESLLAGGRGSDGSALVALEAISPERRTSSVGGLATLVNGRIGGTLVELDDGRLLVAGGVDESGLPVGSIEWLSRDADEHLALRTLPRASYFPGVAALVGGAALLVEGCVPDEGQVCAPCEQGCPPDGGFGAYLVHADGSVGERITLPFSTPTPRLAAASDGSPVLFTGLGGAVWRFDPWGARFVEVDWQGQAAAGTSILSLDPGAVLWIDRSGDLRGARFDTRHVFSHDVGLLAVTHPSSSTWPLHLAAGVSPGEPEAPEFTERRLRVGSVPVFLTDVRFLDFDLEFEVDENDPSPVLHVSDATFGGEQRPWPLRPETGGEGGITHLVERRGTRLRLRRGENVADYEIAPGRHALGWSSENGTSTLTSLRVVRVATGE